MIVVDNFTNSSIEAIKRVEKLTGRGVTTYQLDLLDMAGLEALFDTHEEIEAVFHFAGKLYTYIISRRGWRF